MISNRKTILYIATSIDGYIAQANDDLSFLSLAEKEGEDYGYGAFIDSVDTVILGRKTYDWVMKQVPEFPHADKETYVITRTERPSIGRTHFYTSDLEALVSDLKSRQGKHIFIDGGAEIVYEMLKLKLVDELIISIIPILLGNGTKLFKDGRPAQLFQLVSSQHFERGLVQLHYQTA